MFFTGTNSYMFRLIREPSLAAHIRRLTVKFAAVNLVFYPAMCTANYGYLIGGHVAACPYEEYMLCLTDCKLVFISYLTSKFNDSST